mgnify:CR=1 FL=1|jgi:GPH family glycoside/pentoside/hexuronide:cation symporter|tara:strand:- start:29071 stop:29889 length:819 start_codon:yes stop_codon:yes gene_type:complete
MIEIPHNIADQTHLNLPTKLSYGVGQLSDGVKQASFSTFLFFYYNQVLGLSGSLAGMAALLALMVDAITDPMVGQLSDRFHSRWGRWHPFILAGAIPFGLAIVALFSPPDGLSEMALFAWMLGGAIALRLMLTLFFVPHLSLGAELASDYHGRTSLIGYRVFFTYAGILITSVIGFAVFFPLTAAFSNGLLNKASYGLGSFFAGIGLDIIHFPKSASPEAVPADAVVSLAILSGPVMFLLFTATVIASSRYPLTAVKHREIMCAIKERAEAL